MCCIVLDIELADINFTKKLGVFVDGKLQGYSFRPAKKNKSTKQAFWCSTKLHRIVWNSELSDYSELANIHPRGVGDDNFAKGTEKCKIFGKLLDKEVENLEDHGGPKIQGLVHEEMWICLSYPFYHKTTLHCAERKAYLFGNWIMRHLML